jgi:hypothetical protein
MHGNVDATQTLSADGSAAVRGWLRRVEAEDPCARTLTALSGQDHFDRTTKPTRA